jgi:uncharacterized protein (TIGR02145 family)
MKICRILIIVTFFISVSYSQPSADILWAQFFDDIYVQGDDVYFSVRVINSGTTILSGLWLNVDISNPNGNNVVDGEWYDLPTLYPGAIYETPPSYIWTVQSNSPLGTYLAAVGLTDGTEIYDIVYQIASFNVIEAVPDIQINWAYTNQYSYETGETVQLNVEVENVGNCQLSGLWINADIADHNENNVQEGLWQYLPQIESGAIYETGYQNIWPIPIFASSGEYTITIGVHDSINLYDIVYNIDEFIVEDSQNQFPITEGKLVFHSYSDYENWDGKLFLYDFSNQSLVEISQNWNIDHVINAHFSPDGNYLVFMGVPQGLHDREYWDIYLWEVGDGYPENLTQGNGIPDEDPKFSPDGYNIIFKRNDDIMEMDLEGNNVISITNDGSMNEDSMPFYTSDGLYVIYARGADANSDIYEISLNDYNYNPPLQNIPNLQEMYPITLDDNSYLYARWVSESNHNDQIYLGTFEEEPLNIPFNNENANDSDPYPVQGTDFIIFSSDRPGGQGGWDLYVGDINYSNPISLDNFGLNTSNHELGACYISNINSSEQLDAPIVLVSTGSGIGEIDLSWPIVSGATGYIVVYDEDNDNPPWSPNNNGFPESGTHISSLTRYVTITNLPTGSVYALAVRAYNSNSLGPYSEIVTGNAGTTSIDLESGLIAHYPFSGDANDVSGYGNHGTVHGAELAPDRFGNGNSAYFFNGLNNYIAIQHNETFNITSSISISAWIKPSYYTAGKYVLKKGVGKYSFDIYPGQARIVFNGGPSSHGDTQIVEDVWQHIVAIWNGVFIKVYYNNDLDGVHNWSGQINTDDSNLTIGSYSQLYYCGEIDDIRVYNRSLSEVEIDSLYQINGWGNTDFGCTDPVAINFCDYCSLDDGSCIYSQLGDLNYDGQANILDVVVLVETILSGYEYSQEGDLNNDGINNVSDIVILVDIILNPWTLGCTNVMALNYNPDAQYDDGSCEFQETLEDYDLNIYGVAEIGEQVWMAEDLRVTHYRNGDPISHIDIDTDWVNTISGSYCNYDNNPNLVAIYGLLYNWYSVEDDRGICPEGWHVPSDEEWMELEMYLGMSWSQANEMGFRGTIEGGLLKEEGYIHWLYPNSGAINEHGFTALPAGFRRPNDGSFDDLGIINVVWTSTESSNDEAWRRFLLNSHPGINRFSGDKRSGYSIRCIMD